MDAGGLDHDEPDTSSVDVSIPSADVVDGSFVAFNVHIRKAGTTWSVSRRYRDFHMLYKQLRKRVAVAAFPPKKMRLGRRKFDAAFIERRRSGLEAWLQAVIKIVHPESSGNLDDFIEYSENIILSASRELEGLSELRQVVDILRQAVAGKPAAALVASDDSDLSDADSAATAQDSPHSRSRQSVVFTASAEPPASPSGADAAARQEQLHFAVQQLSDFHTRLLSAHEDLRESISTAEVVGKSLDQKIVYERNSLGKKQDQLEGERRQRELDCERQRDEKRDLSLRCQRIQRDIRLIAGDLDSLQHRTKEYGKQYRKLLENLKQVRSTWGRQVRSGSGGRTEAVKPTRSDSAAPPAAADASSCSSDDSSHEKSANPLESNGPAYFGFMRQAPLIAKATHIATMLQADFEAAVSSVFNNTALYEADPPAMSMEVNSLEPGAVRLSRCPLPGPDRLTETSDEIQSLRRSLACNKSTANWPDVDERLHKLFSGSRKVCSVPVSGPSADVCRLMEGLLFDNVTLAAQMAHTAIFAPYLHDGTKPWPAETLSRDEVQSSTKPITPTVVSSGNATGSEP